MTGIEPDDVREMRQQGDLGRFLRDQIRAGRDRVSVQPHPPPRLPPRRTGEWPATAHDVRSCPTCNPRSAP